MSQLTLTANEDTLVLNAVRAKAAQFLSAFGVEDADLVALLAKIEGQLTLAEAPAAVAAFVDEVPHEQFTHEEDQAEG